MNEHPNDPIEDDLPAFDLTGGPKGDELGDEPRGDAQSADVATEIDGELVPVVDCSQQESEWLENDRVEREPVEVDGQDWVASSVFDEYPLLDEARIASYQDPVLLTTLSPMALEVQPGVPAEMQVQLLNNGDRAALFEVLFEGWIDPAWLDVNPIYKTLQPGERVAVNMTISPPLQPSALAGPRQLVVVVRSPDYPTRESRQVGLLDVLPYDDVQLGPIMPRMAEISWGQRISSFEVPVTNNGNHTVQARIQGQAESTTFHFEPLDAQEIGPFVTEDLVLTLTPGETILLNGSIRPQRLQLFGMQPRVSTFRVLANVVGKMQVPRAAGAQVRCRPLLGPRRVALLAMVLTFAMVALSILGATGFGISRIISSLPVAPNRMDVQSAASPSSTQPPVVAVVVPVDMPVPTSSEPAAGAGPIVVSIGDGGGGIVTPVGPDGVGASAGRDVSVPLVAVGEVSLPGSAPGLASPGIQPSGNQPVDGASPVVVDSSPTPDRSELTYAQMFQEVALRYDLDWRMLAAQAYVESRFDTLALGNDGDLGLMQVLPRTWKEWAPAVDVNDPFDAYSNVLVASIYLDYLRSNLSRNGYSEARWMLIAYNWGPEKLNTFLAEGNDWDDLPDSVRRYAGDILRIAESIPGN
jgi:membrane-bound lytic murein transglycosylase F